MKEWQADYLLALLAYIAATMTAANDHSRKANPVLLLLLIMTMCFFMLAVLHAL